MRIHYQPSPVGQFPPPSGPRGMSGTDRKAASAEPPPKPTSPN